jgi:SAM-dependent methyltransferase
MALALRSEDGARLTLDAARWHGELTMTERQILTGLGAPALDVGCGPGRVVEGLGRAGVAALGVDPVPAAVALAQRRGAAVLQRSIFDPLPGAGRWMTVVLLDGNVGIGGDPVRLLCRCRDLLAVGGSVLVELEPPGRRSGTHRVRLEQGTHCGPWFPWSVVSVDGIAGVASAAGLTVRGIRHAADEDRWFAYLVRGAGAAVD